jgi:hypothetical protein
VVTPYFAIFTFAPKVFESLKLNEMAGTIFPHGIAFIETRLRWLKWWPGASPNR